MRPLSVRIIIILPFLALLFLMPGCEKLRSVTGGSDSTQPPPPTFPDAQSAATQSLITFRQLVNSQNYKDLGFESSEEVANATLGQPIKILVVSLNQLVRYEAGSDPKALLTDFNQIHFPVTVNEQVRSGILVDQTNGKWKSGMFGASNLAKLVGTARSSGGANATSAQESLVHIPALGLYFLARTEEGRMTLTPLVDSLEFGLKAGGAVRAEEVFAALAPFAKSLPTDAPM